MEIAKFYYASCAANSVKSGRPSRATTMAAKAATVAKFGDVDFQEIRDAEDVRCNYEFMSVEKIATESGFSLEELLGT